MKVLQINSVCGVGSTGRIVSDISSVLRVNKYQSYVAYGCGNSKEKNSYKIQGNLYLKYNIAKTRLFGKHGFYNKTSTKKLLNWIDIIKPDIIHLHNIHGHYINIEILFNYIKKNNIPTVWTLHDCWSFTGHCSHFDYIGCNKWMNICNKCNEIKSYPRSLIFDRSKESFKDKKWIFTGVENLTIVTPSEWLAKLVKKSFLNEYEIKVINNGIDLNIFKPTPSNFKEKYGLKSKKVILGVASGFDEKKGYKYFLELANRLDDEYRIVLVGLKEEQIKSLPKNIIGILRTANAKELAEIYTAADVFVNPTLEDTFPTTNIEALACGTPIVTFSTGGSPESISEDTGIVVKRGDIQSLYISIIKITKDNKSRYKQNCIDRAKLLYCKNNKFNEYIDLYERKLK